MFLSEFNHTIDDKGRLTLPAKFRAELSAGVVVTRGLDRCLFIFAKSEWDTVSQQITKLPLTKADARTFARFMFSGASDCEPDKQGRILLPSYLRQYAKLDNDVVIIGAGNRLEVWNPATWRETISGLEDNAQDTAERLADLGIL